MPSLPAWFGSRTILVFRFESRRLLLQAMDYILAHGMADHLDIGHAALILQPPDAPPVVVNNNVTAREGLISGGMIGASIGGLGALQVGAAILPGIGGALAVIGLALVGAGLGSGLGRLVAVRIVFGFRPDVLDHIAQRLHSGEIALVLHVPVEDAAAIADVMRAIDAYPEHV